MPLCTSHARTSITQSVPSRCCPVGQTSCGLGGSSPAPASAPGFGFRGSSSIVGCPGIIAPPSELSTAPPSTFEFTPPSDADAMRGTPPSQGARVGSKRRVISSDDSAPHADVKSSTHRRPPRKASACPCAFSRGAILASGCAAIKQNTLERGQFDSQKSIRNLHRHRFVVLEQIFQLKGLVCGQTHFFSNLTQG